MKKKKIKIKVSVGDVFAIPLGDSKFGYGQVVGEGHPKTYIIYDVISSEHSELANIIRNKVIFFTHTVDVYLEDGDWVLLGNTTVPSTIVFPNYIVDTANGYFITDFKGDILRSASEEDKASLGTRKSVSPSVLEDAVKAKYGFDEWYQYLDNLIYKV